jgi:prepilin-type N-terminal cleavage/methylation domain-containing protein
LANDKPFLPNYNKISKVFEGCDDLGLTTHKRVGKIQTFKEFFMKRSGFTMIELVFVIVILGILASVAIPKLAATRDDANIAKASTEISSLISDLGSYYTAHGSFDNNISKMTNVKLYSDAAGTTAADSASLAVVGSTADVYYVDTKRGKDCLKFTLNDVNGTVNVAKGAAADQSIYCKGLVQAVTDLEKLHTFGGSSIYN